MSFQRFKLIWDGMTYKVSEPGVDSCEVVLAHVYDARVAELEQDVNQLNNVLRHAGWGQGEIDSAAYTFDKLAMANAGLAQQVKDLTVEKESAETERIEWVKRAERAEAVNEELRAELAAHTYTWTTARPTVAGWYWWRIPGHCTEMARIIFTQSGEVVIQFDNGHATYLDQLIACATITPEWAGPIMGPEEGTP